MCPRPGDGQGGGSLAEADGAFQRHAFGQASSEATDKGVTGGGGIDRHHRLDRQVQVALAIGVENALAAEGDQYAAGAIGQQLLRSLQRAARRVDSDAGQQRSFALVGNQVVDQAVPCLLYTSDAADE